MPRMVSGPDGGRARASDSHEQEDAGLPLELEGREEAPSVGQPEDDLAGSSGERQRVRRLTIDLA
jgi:hypothetical protein